MNKWMRFVPALALALAACHKQAAAPAAQAPEAVQVAGDAPAAQNVPPTPLPPPAPPLLTVTENADDTIRANVTGDVSPFLTQQLRLFIQDNRRLPQNFNEFMRARLDSMPRPPEGQKWVIDKVTQEVKAVAK